MTDVVIMRHGHALSAGEDPERGLSEEGRLESREVAGRLAAAGVRVDQVLHSGKKRARETAEILSEAIGGGANPQRRGGLEPFDFVEGMAMELGGVSAATAVVGHLPHLDRLLARLLRRSDAPTLGTSYAAHLRRSGASWELIALYRPG